VKEEKPKDLGRDVQTDTLDAIDKNILTMELERPGITNKAISEVIGIGPDLISKRRKATAYQRALHELLKSPLDIIRDGQAKAARKLIKLLDAKDPETGMDDIKTQMNAVATILRPVLPHAVAHGTTDDFEATLAGMSDDALQRFLTEGAAVINESDVEIIDAEVIESPDTED
jgi:hypothetical protein